MKYECWGHISKYGDGRWTVTKFKNNKPEPINPCQLPDWIKIKIAMMDFIKDYEELPCGSHKACYNRLELLIYYLFTEVSSTRQEGERSVDGCLVLDVQGVAGGGNDEI